MVTILFVNPHPSAFVLHSIPIQQLLTCVPFAYMFIKVFSNHHTLCHFIQRAPELPSDIQPMGVVSSFMVMILSVILVSFLNTIHILYVCMCG